MALEAIIFSKCEPYQHYEAGPNIPPSKTPKTAIRDR